MLVIFDYPWNHIAPRHFIDSNVKNSAICCGPVVHNSYRSKTVLVETGQVGVVSAQHNTMLLLLLFTFTLSSAYIDDLTTQLELLGCWPQNQSPLQEIDPNNAIAVELSKYCNSVEEIADCIQSKEGHSSTDSVVRYFNEAFDIERMKTKSDELCNDLKNTTVASYLNCLDDSTHNPCYSSWGLILEDTFSSRPSYSLYDLCVTTVNHKNCVMSVIDGQPGCNDSVADFMGAYVTVLSGSPSNCEYLFKYDDHDHEPPATETATSSLYLEYLDMDGSAIKECSEMIDSMAAVIETRLSVDFPDYLIIIEDVMDIFCAQRTTLMSCLKEKMPDSTSVIDQIALIYVDLQGVDRSLENYCVNKKVLTDNAECLRSDETQQAIRGCIPSFEFFNDIESQMFAVADYTCSALVNTSRCFGEKLKMNCNEEISGLMTSTYIDMLTPYCKHAKPKPFVDVLQPGWSYTLVPGGNAAMECIFPIIKKLLPKVESTDNNGEIQSAMQEFCRNADSMLRCLETRIPKGLSTTDKLVEDVIDLPKLRTTVTSKCSRQNEIISLLHCLWDGRTLEVQNMCLEGFSWEFMEKEMGVQGKKFDTFIASMPSSMGKIKDMFYRDDSSYYNWVKCEVNAIRACNSVLAGHVSDLLTVPIRSKKTTGCVGTKCSACSMTLHQFLWYFVMVLAIYETMPHM
ncbi:hypothetical protein ScPMuIL_010114 [Solemya velum]